MQHVLDKGEETKELLERMVAHHSQRLADMVVENVTRTERRFEGEMREFHRRLAMLEGPAASHREDRELLREEEIKKE